MCRFYNTKKIPEIVKVLIRDDERSQETILRLTKENEILKENNRSMQEEMIRVWEENERLKKEYKSKVDDIGKLTSKIYKTIEYINNTVIPFGDEWHWDNGSIEYYVNNIITILQGSDKE